MATQRVLPEELTEHVRGFIHDNLGSTLPADAKGNRLQTVTVGSLDYFPARVPATSLPGVFVRLLRYTMAFHATGHKIYETTYTLRLVYVRQHAPEEEVVSVKMNVSKLLVEELIVQHNLPSLTMPSGTEAGQVVWTLPRQVDLEPAEETILVALQQEDLVAVAVEFDVKVLTRR